MTNAPDRKRLLLASLLVALAIAAAIAAYLFTASGNGETHRRLSDVPPKGAGKVDRG